MPEVVALSNLESKVPCGTEGSGGSVPTALHLVEASRVNESCVPGFWVYALVVMDKHYQGLSSIRDMGNMWESSP
jgi:hypothetical protein